MKKIFLIAAIFVFAGFLDSAHAEKKTDKQIGPDSPIVTTWSKIKELFE